MRLLVCGGRNFADAEKMDAKLRSILRDGAMTPHTIIHGGASGADTLAGEWAALNGCLCEVYPADWSNHGRAAGPIRNRQMIVEGRPHAVLAMEGGKGTANMVKQAIAAGLPVHYAPSCPHPVTDTKGD